MVPTGALSVGPCTPPSAMLTAALRDCLPREPPSRVVCHQQIWPSRHPRSSSLRLPARCFRLQRLSIALHQSQLHFKPKSRTQHMSFTSSSTTNPHPGPNPHPAKKQVHGLYAQLTSHGEYKPADVSVSKSATTTGYSQALDITITDPTGKTAVWRNSARQVAGSRNQA